MFWETLRNCSDENNVLGPGAAAVVFVTAAAVAVRRCVCVYCQKTAFLFWIMKGTIYAATVSVTAAAAAAIVTTAP